MGRFYSRIAAVLTLICFIGSMAACTTCKQRYAVKTAGDLHDISLDPEKKYDVVFDSGNKYRIKGNQLQVMGDTLGIKYSPNEEFHYYRYSQLNEVCERGISGGKTAGLVAGIVGGIGALIGITIAVIHSLPKDSASW